MPEALTALLRFSPWLPQQLFRVPGSLHHMPDEAQKGDTAAAEIWQLCRFFGRLSVVAFSSSARQAGHDPFPLRLNTPPQPPITNMPGKRA